jgi:glycosyltransferase involved in cell wall biosynthesis
LHICLISVEIFAWGKYGGFGRATRAIGLELVKRGIQVTAIVPRRNGQKEIEYLDGIKVFGFDYRKPLEMLRIFRECNADIFHSEEPSTGTYIAQKMHPDKKHVVTFRDTRLFSDWITEFNYPSMSRMQVLSNWLFEDNLFVHRTVRKADKRFVAARLLVDRAVTKYKLNTRPELLPTPIEVPIRVEKSKVPTVCYVARWDRRKRPELLVALAKSFPNVRFLIAGASRDPEYDRKIRDQFAAYPNVELLGFINQFETEKIAQVFSQSWILVNTAAREGLPTSFIEACAYRCAILSSVDPDGFATQFGYYSTSDDFSTGLEWLLQNENWKNKGLAGYEYVGAIFSTNNAIDKHLSIYKGLLQDGE